ncbi:MAG: histidinol-phosphate aminotransferase family protein [Asgard group archaeon]|nr:histidinol-phosphate aminotransferase family protein [Asgard group archaeon]
MSNKEKNLANLINDPFKGKGGFMPEKIKEKIIVRIGLNENLAFPEKKIKELMKMVAEKIDPRIYPEDYCDSLCAIIANENNLNQNQVVVGNGGDKIIDLMVRLTIKSGYNAVILNPTYPMYEHAVRVQGGGMTELLLSPAPEFDLNPNYILNNITPKKDRLLFLCSPNNPTGNQFDIKKLKQIISEFPGIVALDETYSDFGNYSLIPSLHKFPNLIIMKSLSKFHGMAGMRVGYAIASDFLINRIKELHPAFNVNIASLELAKLVMQEKSILNQIVDDIVKGREFVYNELSKISRITPYKSFTNFLLFRIDDVNAEDVQKKLLQEKGVLVRNMSAMPLCENSLRVSITTMENNQAFVNSIADIMNKI